MANNITIKIASDVSSAVQGINQVNQKLDSLIRAGESVRNKFTQMTAVAGGISMAYGAVSNVVGKVVATVNSLVTAYSTQASAEVRLQQTLAATQEACGMSASELMNLAESLQQVTSYSDQEIMAVEQVLVATRKIGRDVIPEATMAILDMAAATGEDATGAAQRLAQALADPAGEIESLKEANIQLSEEQAENIKKVQEQNGLYEAQKLLLQEVNSTYGGIATTLANTDIGKIDKLKNAWQDLKEGLGETLMNSLDGVLDYTLSLVEKVEGFVSEHNHNNSIEEQASSLLLSGTTDLTGVSDEVLNKILSYTAYDEWLSNFPGTSFENVDPYLVKALNTYQAARNERIQRDRIPFWQAMDEANGGRKPVRVNTTYEEWLENYLTVMAALDAKLKGEDSTEDGTSSESSTSAVSRPDVAGFISSNRGLSVSAQVAYIQDQINTAQTMRWNTAYGSDQYNQIMEIIGALEQQKKALLDVAEATDEVTDSQSATEKVLETLDDVKQYIDPLMEIGSYVSEIFSNMADSAADALSKIEDKWDEYFDELDRKQERQSDSLNALLGAGKISYEDYINAQKGLDEERAAKQQEAMEEEEAAREKADSLAEAAFNANKINSLAQASINIAEGVTKAIAQGGIAGIALGTVVSAAGAAQIGAIMSQQYTPLAAGGIVTKPTFALLGEGGNKEAVLPLNETNMERAGFSRSDGSIIININIDRNYSQGQLEEEIFRGIERAQKTGALPNWRYA